MQHLFLIFSLLFLNTQQSFNWVSFEMLKRSSKNGAITKIDAKVFYKSSGEMVTYFSDPTEMYILNNSLGDLQIYNAKENKVFRTLDNRLGSQNNTFYYFLLGNSDDMGLEASGFKLKSSRVEEMLLISDWEPPNESNKELEKVEVVSNGNYPVFMGYMSKDGTYIKKIFYYDYETIKNTYFPKSITEIDFLEGDSVITKTSFSNFRFDNDEDSKKANFKVPETAILTK